MGAAAAEEEQSFCKSIRTKEALFTCIIPGAFMERHGHLLGKELSAETSSGSWKLGVSEVDGETFIETGWRGFCADNRLAVDDVVVFQLLEASRFLIKVYAGDGSRKTIEAPAAAASAPAPAAKSVENANPGQDFVQITPGGNNDAGEAGAEEEDGSPHSAEDRTATDPAQRDPECPAAPVTPLNCAVSKAVAFGTLDSQRANNKRKNIEIQVLESGSDDDEVEAVGFIVGSVAPTLRRTYFTRRKSFSSSAAENTRRTSGAAGESNLDAGSGTLDSETNSANDNSGGHHPVASKKYGTTKRGVHMKKRKKKKEPAPPTSSQSAIAAASSFTSTNPCFPMALKKTCLDPCYYLPVPSVFAKNYMPREEVEAIMLDEEDKQYPVKWLAKGVVSGGWRAFARSQKIMPEDAIVLEVIDDRTFRCHVFRGTAAD